MRTSRIIAGVAGIAAFGLVLTGCSSGGSAGAADDGTGEYTLTLGHEGSSTDPRQAGAEELAALIEEKTDGRVTVEVHGDSTLGNFSEMIDGLQLGSTDIVIESPLALESYTNLAAIDTAPFLYENEDQFFAVWDGEIGDEIKQALTEESGYALLGNMYRGARQLTTKTPVESLDDLSGKTIRTPQAETMLATWNELGPVPKPCRSTRCIRRLNRVCLMGRRTRSMRSTPTRSTRSRLRSPRPHISTPITTS